MGDGCLNPYIETNYMIGSEMVEVTEMLLSVKVSKKKDL